MAGAAALVDLALNEPPPIEASVGAEVAVRLRASCPAGHDRRGMAVRLVAPDGAETSHALVGHDEDVTETADIVLKVPPRVGEHVWRMVLPAHEIAGTAYQEAALVVAVQARAQTTSLAVWDIPSPVVAGSRFAVKAGAKSSASCALRGRAVEVLRGDEIVAHGVLGDEPWPGTTALHWCELSLAAPAAPGLADWSVRFAADGLELPHEDSSTEFSAAVVLPPEHRLTVRVLEKDTAEPVGEAVVRLGAYRAETGGAGWAEILLPKGRYELSVWKAGYDIAPAMVEIGGDVSIELHAAAVPEEDPDARWKM